MHLDRHLADLVQAYPGWIYGLMFLVIFAETGLVFMGFLPGDSLLFAAGALAAGDRILEIRILLPALILASFAGDQANYLIGHLVGEHPFRRDGRLFNRENLEKAKRFYARHGGQAVVTGRFIPVLRSVTPLAAAVGSMPYPRFLIFSVMGSSLWAGLFILVGYFLGRLPAVKGNFAWIILGVILVSCLPGAIQILAEGGRPGSRGRRHALRAS